MDLAVRCELVQVDWVANEATRQVVIISDDGTKSEMTYEEYLKSNIVCVAMDPDGLSRIRYDDFVLERDFRRMGKRTMVLVATLRHLHEVTVTHTNYTLHDLSFQQMKDICESKLKSVVHNLLINFYNTGMASMHGSSR